jgi:hypothetical protein
VEHHIGEFTLSNLKMRALWEVLSQRYSRVEAAAIEEVPEILEGYEAKEPSVQEIWDFLCPKA